MTARLLAVALLLARPAVDSTASETARVRTHLATVESELRRTDVSALTPVQRRARARNLDVLHEYWVREVFPVNTDFPGQRVPYFVDRYGTRCAMAYLIEQSGWGDLVARIASTHNNAYVRDLKDDAELAAWLRDNGLTAAEAARIQPTYGSPYADFVGRWEGQVTFGDSVNVRYVLTTTGPADKWTIRFANDRPIPIRIVAFGGDSLVTEGGPLASILDPRQTMTRLRTTLHYGGSVLAGTIEARYPSGAVVRGRTEAALACPGPATPENVVDFVGRANLPKVRCMTATAAMLDNQATVFRVTYRRRGLWGFGTRFALRWRGRVGWILDDETPPDSSPPGTFRVRPNDTLLVTPTFLGAMTAQGLRLQWARTLLRDPDVPRFVLQGLIGALKDTVDETLAALLVSAPLVTRDPELLVELAHLPVAPDSAFRRSDGGMVYMSAQTGYAGARDRADVLLRKQSLALIAAPDTPHDVLVTIATWNDRHMFCAPPPGTGEVSEALRARATRDRDTTLLAAMARVRSCM